MKEIKEALSYMTAKDLLEGCLFFGMMAIEIFVVLLIFG